MAEAQTRTALITGIRGQDGTYLAELLLTKKYRVIGTTHQHDALGTVRLAEHDVPVEALNLRDERQIRDIIEHYRPNEFYNFAARSSSTQLFDDPIATADINGLAVIRILEAIRHIHPSTRFCQASSSEIYAATTQTPQGETTPMCPRNAYGAAKLFAQNMVAAYRQQFNLFACTAILFNHESPRRGLEYVTRKVVNAAVRIEAGEMSTLSIGNLDSRRDWGFAGDYVEAMWLMLQQHAPDDFVIATGLTHSVRDLCRLAFSRLGLDYRDYVVVEDTLSRRQEHVELCGDPRKAFTMLGWKPSTSFTGLVNMMVDAEKIRFSR